MKFVDEIEIRVRGGHGGAGSVHFLREKYRENGGPDGGDGGHGGSVYLEAHSGTQSLGHYLTKSLFVAEHGDDGRGKNRTGKDGEDLVLRVPPGTVVIDSDTGEEIGDLHKPEERLLVAPGGKGGLGNQHFATSVNQAPDHAQPGIPGDEKRLTLALKLLADAGLIGLPNAGKSTIIKAISGSHARVGEYAFTTLVPNLGVVYGENHRRLLLADIPGIIEGASHGAGLGLSFLRHIERVKVIVYVIDVGSLQPVDELKMLRSELATYSKELVERPSIIVLNKMDQAKYDDEYADSIAELLRAPDLWEGHAHGTPDILYISALENRGLDTLVKRLFSFFSDPTIAEGMLPGSRNEPL